MSDSTGASKAVAWIALLSSAAAIVWAGGLFLKFLTGISREGVLIAVGLLVGIVVVQAAWNRLLQLDR